MAVNSRLLANRPVRPWLHEAKLGLWKSTSAQKNKLRLLNEALDLKYDTSTRQHLWDRGQ